jgi:hypothetical protein
MRRCEFGSLYSNYSKLKNFPEPPCRPKLPCRPKPYRPPILLIQENVYPTFCQYCKSSLKWKTFLGRWFGIGKTLGCINPECQNYFQKPPPSEEIEQTELHQQISDQLDELGFQKISLRKNDK